MNCPSEVYENPMDMLGVRNPTCALQRHITLPPAAPGRGESVREEEENSWPVEALGSSPSSCRNVIGGAGHSWKKVVCRSRINFRLV